MWSVYSFSAQLIQFNVVQRRLITVVIHEDAISLSTQFIYRVFLKLCLPSSRIHALSDATGE